VRLAPRKECHSSERHRTDAVAAGDTDTLPLADGDAPLDELAFSLRVGATLAEPAPVADADPVAVTEALPREAAIGERGGVSRTQSQRLVQISECPVVAALRLAGAQGGTGFADVDCGKTMPPDALQALNPSSRISYFFDQESPS
jgi:hypothetical protein